MEKRYFRGDPIGRALTVRSQASEDSNGDDDLYVTISVSRQRPSGFSKGQSAQLQGLRSDGQGGCLVTDLGVPAGDVVGMDANSLLADGDHWSQQGEAP